MSAHAHTGGMTRRRLLHAGALAGVAAGGGGGGGGGAPPGGAGRRWRAVRDNHKQRERRGVVFIK
ncbi:cellulase, partial [Xanthomonas euvesicatoria]